MYCICVCVCVCISTLKQGQLCLTAEHCLQLLFCQSFSHDMSHNTFWKLLIFRDWVQTKFLGFFCYCCCPVIYPVSAEQGYILNCCHVEGREWSCQSCTARLCVFQTNPVLLLCHSKANWVALMLCEPGGLCIVVSWWQEEQVRKNCSRPVFGQSCPPLIVLIPHCKELVSLSYGRSQDSPPPLSLQPLPYNISVQGLWHHTCWVLLWF